MNKLLYNQYNPYDPYNSCNPTNTTNTDTTNNKFYNNIYKKLKHDIKNNKPLTTENIDFIQSLSNDKKMKIILLYNKIVESNKKLLDELLHNNLLR